jgi:1-deoxy-D-xylulose-5-phosphate reductoisomerase
VDWTERPLCVLGASGSIGENTLDVARRLDIPIHTLTAHSRVERLAELAVAHGAQRVVIADGERYTQLKELLAGHDGIDIQAGPEALAAAAADEAVGTVVTAIVGAAGLPATLAAAQAGKRLAIANKEPLVMAGELVMKTAAENDATVLPVDSEHSAIFQCLEGHRPDEVERLVLTASGGPFRQEKDLALVTIERALKHPNWDMGPKITIDSATLMNKALEVIEARWLFDIPIEQIDVVVHPQSVVHSMVAYRDGSLMAQMGLPDMRTPIQYALTWPSHTAGPVASPDLTSIASLHFEQPDHQRFPALELGRTAGAMGGVGPAVFNAANEAAVARFLDGAIPFTAITEIVAQVLQRCPKHDQPDLDAIIAADQWGREQAEQQVVS